MVYWLCVVRYHHTFINHILLIIASILAAMAISAAVERSLGDYSANIARVDSSTGRNSSAPHVSLGFVTMCT